MASKSAVFSSTVDNPCMRITFDRNPLQFIPVFGGGQVPPGSGGDVMGYPAIGVADVMASRLFHVNHVLHDKESVHGKHFCSDKCIDVSTERCL